MDIKLYSTGCPKCIVLGSKLDAAGIPYTVVDDEDLMIAMGFTEAPKLSVDGEIKDFGEAIAWVNRSEV